MLRAIVHAGLRLRGVVVALACIALVYGIGAVRSARLDVFPDFAPPQVTVQTEAPGFSAEQVERLVTTPVEAALGGLGGLTALRSESIQGLSAITVMFEEGTDVYHDRQLLAERLASVAGRLPLGVRAPTLSALTSATMDLLKIGLVSERLSPMELRSFADWTLRPRLLAVPGVAQVNVFGGQVRQLQVQVHPDQLLAHGLALSDVLAAARTSTGIAGAGFIDTPNQRIVLATEGQVAGAAELAGVEVARRDGRSVVLGDVATVVDGGAPRFGDASIMGEPGVLVSLLSQYGANTLEVTRAVEEALAGMRPTLDAEGIRLEPRLHRPASFIESALRNLRTSLVLGGILVVLVLFLFLEDPRSALVSVTAIPLSLLAAAIVLVRAGFTLDTMTLGGLAIAIGEVVDDAIVDVENIVRRLRQNRQLERPRAPLLVVLDASLEVRSAVVFASLAVVVMFLPVLTLTGVQGSFFAPLALAYVLAILASMLVALTVTPALTLAVFARTAPREREPRLQRWIKDRYGRLLPRISRHAGRVALATALLCLGALGILPFLGGEFLPSFNEGHFVLQVSATPGTSLEEMTRLGGSISRALLAVPDVATVEQQLGRAEQGEDTWPPHRSEIHVELTSPDARNQGGTAETIRQVLAGFPGLQTEVLTFLGDRIGESITGERAPLVVSIFGDDLDRLDGVARRVADVLATVPGAADVTRTAPPQGPQTVIRLRPERLLQMGFRPLDVMEAVQTAYQGAVVAQHYEGNRSVDVVVLFDAESRRDPERVGTLLLQNAEGLRVPLATLADVETVGARDTILHEGGRRRQVVTSNTRRDVMSFSRDARRLVVEQVKLPAGTYLEFGGEAEAQVAARSELLRHAALALAAVALLLRIAFGTWRILGLVVLNLPFALVGGVLAMAIAGWFDPAAGRLSMGTLVGFVTLFGITLRNAIMLVSHWTHLVREEGRPWNTETAFRGATERVIPILMTASVTALGLLPLALGSGQAGREIEGPMAVVILGGLITSTALNLLVLPTLAVRWAPIEPAAAAQP